MAVALIQMPRAAQMNSIVVQEVTLALVVSLMKCFISVAIDLRKIIKSCYVVTIQLKLFQAKIVKESNCAKLRFLFEWIIPDILKKKILTRMFCFK